MVVLSARKQLSKTRLVVDELVKPAVSVIVQYVARIVPEPVFAVLVQLVEFLALLLWPILALMPQTQDEKVGLLSELGLGGVGFISVRNYIFFKTNPKD